ncbi:MAG: SDR family oxidoreductase [Planctomycetaceae bacterium]|jgi:NAD(P)-dependent dehydrogenase (short-subunit alcohol dehydrogenase family)|nr:SDR family oxidoreductase [Planctomycetaceae bacterium]
MTQNLFDLTGKKAIVTGAAVGIGRGYAAALAKAGADVAIVDLDEKTGTKTANEIISYGKDSIFVRCDVTKKEQVDAMMDAVLQKFGRIDIGVNNAGIGILGGDLDFSPENWNKVINVNLTGMFLCAQAEAQQFVKQNPVGGKIINTASMSARICNCNASYNASKGGVVEMTRMLAAEWGTYNINVNCISPSYILSPMHASTPLEVRTRIRELTPLGYVQRPEDLYGPVIFLASEASNYVTGLDLLVDGGHTLNAWLTPLQRETPPRISPEQETVQLKHDLTAMELSFDENGINESLHPEIANAFKTAFGLNKN